MDKEEILKMCESILRDIHECDKVYLHVDRIKSIINKRVEPCENCKTGTYTIHLPGFTAMAIENQHRNHGPLDVELQTQYCPDCGRKM